MLTFSKIEFNSCYKYIDSCLRFRNHLYTSRVVDGIFLARCWMLCMDNKCECTCLWKTTYLCLWIITLGGGKYLGCCWYDSTLQCCILTLLAKDYRSLLGARIMQGFGTGPFEMLVPSSIGDMLRSFAFHSWLSGILFINGVNELLFKQCRCLE